MSLRAVLHVSANRYPPLPQEHHTLSIWRQLAPVADEYHVVARAAGGAASETRADNIVLHLLSSRMERQAEIFLLERQLNAVAAKVRPEVIVAQCPVMGGRAAARYASATGTPLFVEMHGENLFRSAGEDTVRGRLFRRLARPVLEQAAVVRVLSDHMLRALEESYGPGVAAKAVVVPTRVDLEVFSPAKVDYCRHGALRIITVGSFVPLKNHLELIEAMSELPDTTLSLVGQGPLESDYRARIRDLGMEHRVTLHPWVSHDELATLLARHDVYVHYSTTEALSRAILEAMAIGLPVVATNVGFVQGVLRDGQNALLLDQPWRASLHAALRRLGEHETVRRELGVQARRTIEEGFSAASVFRSYRSEITRAAGVGRR